MSIILTVIWSSSCVWTHSAHWAQSPSPVTPGNDPKPPVLYIINICDQPFEKKSSSRHRAADYEIRQGCTGSQNSDWAHKPKTKNITHSWKQKVTEQEKATGQQRETWTKIERQNYNSTRARGKEIKLKKRAFSYRCRLSCTSASSAWCCCCWHTVLSYKVTLTAERRRVCARVCDEWWWMRVEPIFVTSLCQLTHSQL